MSYKRCMDRILTKSRGMSTCGSRTEEGKFYRKTNVYLMKKSTDTFQILSSYNVTTSGYHSPLPLPYHSESTCFLGSWVDRILPYFQSDHTFPCFTEFPESTVLLSSGLYL